MATGQDFIEQLRRDTEPLLRRVTQHVFVQDTINGLLPLEALVRFAVQEHHYVRGIYDYFAMCVLQAPDLDMKEWFIEVAGREVGYLGLYRNFLQGLGVTAEALRASQPLPGALAATNYQFRLAGSATPGENMAAVLIPSSATFSAFVETATKCLATALASPPKPRSDQSRAACALVMVSSVVKVFEEMMNSVSAASRSRTASTKSVASMLDTKRNVMARSL